nr:MAG TPA: hypothetical protein [Caudoviricetes sp.]
MGIAFIFRIDFFHAFQDGFFKYFGSFFRHNNKIKYRTERKKRQGFKLDT